ncbi:shikimate kinase [Humibacter ginsenosidimutans]|uniref:Shikimate kinase n=1 Tax=Humibacter ginsenosidimutans TaxID=2599293 RepID=A0A5B8M0J4_9MICO|nr:shikimate kinase [Humibacter ginsenosidimutans]QDZ13843.1 shikimate kinase [Humibacter ginsenosidimutans]
MTVVLIGPPAAGKTRVGKRLARSLGETFIDTDAVIVAKYGPISGIFAERGEEAFRAIERDVVAEALALGGVVSFGGGAVLDPRTQADLAAAKVVLLTVSPEVIAARINDGKRPLVQSVESWRALVEKRMPLYESLADYRADTSRRPITTIVDEIAEWVQEQERTQA